MEYIAKYVYGSHNSLDIDSVYIVDTLPPLVDCKRICSENTTENMNLATIANGCISACYKGTVDELNNAVYMTYDLHEQTSPLLIERMVDRDIPLKFIRSIRSILSHLSRSQYREDIKLALRSSWTERLNVLSNINLNDIDFGTLNKNMSAEDVIKLIAFQIGQTKALIEGHEFFTKDDVGRYYPKLSPYLSRSSTSLDDLISALKSFIEMLRYFFPYETDDTNVNFKTFGAYNLKTETKI